MAKPSAEDNAKAILFLLAIIFIAGGYFVAWLTIQKILFYQTLFWVCFLGSLIFLLAMIGFFIAFLFKEDEVYYWGYNEFFNKATLGLASLICLVLLIISLLMMVNAYHKGFSDEAMETLANAQGKLDEFNYIRDVLTGVEIQRLLTEGFDEAMQDICDSNPNYDCEQLTKSYQSINNILEAKGRADNIAKFFGLVEKS
jgi:hypothetical protein